MHEYRITKYDPRNRNEQGHYLLDEWTEFADVGQSVTLEAYEAVEQAYLDSAKDMLSTGGASEVSICSLWDGNGLSPYKECERLSLDAIPNTLRSMLRGEYGCRLESKTAFVHVGWDFYMYVGVVKYPAEAIVRTRERGLFVEEFESPYHNDDDWE